MQFGCASGHTTRQLDFKLHKQTSLAAQCLSVQEVARLVELVQDDVDLAGLTGSLVRDLPSLGRSLVMSWSDRVLAS